MLETHLRARRDAGRALLMPYVTGGITANWTDYLRAFADAGADAIEVGLPFSDPTLDGLTIQAASYAALARGATARRILGDITGLDVTGLDRDVPLVASTYYNLVLRDGPEQFCAALREAGITGLIVPDLPLDEAGELEGLAAAAGVDLVLLASPATPQPRLDEIARRSRGFVYTVSLMGTTGERASFTESASDLARRIKRGTDRPVMLGFGISTPEHAVEATRSADGVIVGAAIMSRVLNGASPQDVGADLARMRRALDHETDQRPGV